MGTPFDGQHEGPLVHYLCFYCYLIIIVFLGRLLVTNLRLIWHSQSMPRVNLCKCLEYNFSVLFKHGLPYSSVCSKSLLFPVN